MDIVSEGADDLYSSCPICLNTLDVMLRHLWHTYTLSCYVWHLLSARHHGVLQAALPDVMLL